MATFKKLSTETLQLVLGNGLSLVLGLGVSIIITRALGEEARGIYAWLFTLQGLGAQVATLVTYQAARQLAAAHPEADWPRLATSITALACAGSLLALPFLLYGLTEPTLGIHQTSLLLLAFSIIPFTAAAVPLGAMVNTRGRLWPNLLCISGQRVTLVAGVGVLMLTGHLTLWAVTWLNVASAVVILLLIFWLLWRPSRWPLGTLRADLALLRNLRQFLGITWLAGLALFALPKLVILQLGSSGQLSATGHYSVATTLFEAALIVPMLAGSVLITHFTRTASSQGSRRKVTLALLGVTTAIAAVAAGGAPWVIPLLFGAPFAAAVAPFQVLMVVLVLAALQQAWFSRLMAAKAIWPLLLPPLAGCLTVLTIGTPLIAAHGVMGAAYATLAGYTAMVALTYALKGKL